MAKKASKKSPTFKKKYPRKFKAGEAIVFDPPKWKVEDFPDHPLKRNQVVYFLTGIPNVPGHCIVTTWDGDVIPMLHPGDFRTADDSEL